MHAPCMHHACITGELYERLRKDEQSPAVVHAWEDRQTSITSQEVRDKQKQLCLKSASGMSAVQLAAATTEEIAEAARVEGVKNGTSKPHT